MSTKKVGVIGVDAGLCWIGDPCYILHTDRPPKEIGKNWEEFCGLVEGKEEKSEFEGVQFNYDGGSPGFGVVVPTGYGDGIYPVYATYDRNGRVISVEVRFDERGEDGEDNE